jgi:hypothetical protein
MRHQSEQDCQEKVRDSNLHQTKKIPDSNKRKSKLKKPDWVDCSLPGISRRCRSRWQCPPHAPNSWTGNWRTCCHLPTRFSLYFIQPGVKVTLLGYILAKNWPLWPKILINYDEKLIIPLVFKKNDRKLVKISEKWNHNVGHCFISQSFPLNCCVHTYTYVH